MTSSSGKIRIYELSKDLSLDNKDVLDAASKLAIAAKSHSSSISSIEATKIKDFLKKSNIGQANNKPTKKLDKEILSLKKSSPKAQKVHKTELKQTPPTQSQNSPSNLKVPLKQNETLVKSKESILPNDEKLVKNKAHNQQQITAPSKPNKPLPPKPRKEVKPTISKVVPKTEKEISLHEHRKDTKLTNRPKITESDENPKNQPKPTYRQEPKRPLPPPSRPQVSTQDKKQPQLNNQKTKTKINPGNIPPQKGGTGSFQRIKNQNRQNPPSRAPQPPTKGNTLELVGAPIRREKPINRPQTNEVRNKPLMPSRPGAPKPPVSSNRQGPTSNRPGSWRA